MTYARTALIACTSLLLALAAPTTAPAAAINCPPLASKIVTAASVITTTSTSAVNVAGTAINFVQGGSTAGCVLVSFSADAGADHDETMYAHALLDGAIFCQPGSLHFVTSNATAPPAR